MSKKVEVDLRAEEGQFLLNMCNNFNLPDKKDRDGKINEDGFLVVEQNIARDEVRMLLRELKAHSPLMCKRGKDFRMIFGDPENTLKEGENTSIKDLDAPTRVKLDTDAMSGAVWCMIFALHPSMMAAGAIIAENVVWPLAVKLRKTDALRDFLGLNNKSKAKTWKDDPEPDAELEAAKKADAKAAGEETV